MLSYFGVSSHSIIHQTLTWNTVSLTYMCDNFTSVYRQGTIVTESHLKDLESALNLTSLENPHGWAHNLTHNSHTFSLLLVYVEGPRSNCWHSDTWSGVHPKAPLVPSKHARSNSAHPGRIGWEPLARSWPDDSCKLACFRTGSVWPKPGTISQN